MGQNLRPGKNAAFTSFLVLTCMNQVNHLTIKLVIGVPDFDPYLDPQAALYFKLNLGAHRQGVVSREEAEPEATTLKNHGAKC